MFKQKHFHRFIILVLSLSLISGVVARPQAATSPGLGAADAFSILAETNIVNVPASSIGGDVGLSPATGASIGLTDPEVGGTIYSVDAFGPAGAVNDPALLTNAVNAMMAAFTALDQPCDTAYAGVQDLTIVSPLGPGVYCANAFLLTGNLTLIGSGVWIFKSAATLTTSAGSSVTGGDPCNVWWRNVSSVDIFTGSSMVGSVFAGTSINLQNGASVDGRLLAQAAVTLDSNTVSGPSCVVAAAGGGGGGGGTTAGTTADDDESDSSILGLPDTGGAPIREETPVQDESLIRDNTAANLLLIAVSGIIIVVLGVRAYRRQQ
jgi:hypothetical protein